MTNDNGFTDEGEISREMDRYLEYRGSHLKLVAPVAGGGGTQEDPPACGHGPNTRLRLTETCECGQVLTDEWFGPEGER